MKKHILAFVFSFFFSFLLFLAVTHFSILTGQQAAERNLEIYLLLAAGSGFIAFANLLYSIFITAEDNRAIGEFTAEVVQSGTIFIQASRLLFLPLVLPLWLVLLAYAVAEFYLFQMFPLGGLVLVIVAQFFWFLWRGRLFDFSDSKVVSISLYTPLRFFFRGVDLISILMVVAMVGVIREFAFIQRPLLLMGISLILAVGLLAWNQGGMKRILKADLPIFLAPLFLWVTIVIAALNFFDIATPVSEVEVSYQDCPGASNRLLTVAGKEIQGPLSEEVYYGCQLMGKGAGVEQNSKIVIVQHRGALGIRWLSSKQR